MLTRQSNTPTPDDPVWEIARLFPAQGEWNESDYLALDTNHLVELNDGIVEFPSMPTPPHQRIALYLYRMLWAFVTDQELGEVLVAPLRVRLWQRHFREPDVIFIFAQKLAEQNNRYWENVDLVMEVVSEDDPNRDYIDKRQEYALAKIPEYWIVDPFQRTVLVLTLMGEKYQEVGQFGLTERAESALLPGFGVNVQDIFAAGGTKL